MCYRLNYYISQDATNKTYIIYFLDKNPYCITQEIFSLRKEVDTFPGSKKKTPKNKLKSFYQTFWPAFRPSASLNEAISSQRVGLKISLALDPQDFINHSLDLAL